jgi:allophanate hydrolase
MHTAARKLNMDIASLRGMLVANELSLTELVHIIYAQAEAYLDYNIWIYLLPKEQVLKKAAELEQVKDKSALPLYGIPYGVKDNIDVAGIPTTAACKEFTYIPSESAEAVEKIGKAGALLIGKTNLDQFATGLVGTRSPYGIVKNSFNPDYISGGSSSGSAVALALGMVSFSLGTDTAGSGRVPAGFNHLIGLKPTKKLISTKGVVPACKSLDCVSIFALSCEDAHYVLDIVKEPSLENMLKEVKELPSSFTFGIPKKEQLNFSGNTEYESLYYKALEKLEKAGGKMVEFDFASFLETAELLYEGPWLAERLASIKDFFASNADSLLKETKKIIEGGSNYSAVDTFLSLYKLDDLKAKAYKSIEGMDVLVMPTTPTIYKIEDIAKEPFSLNKNLGYYTNFVNLLDLCALAVPNGFQSNGLPMGITFIAHAHHDLKLAQLGKLFPR